MPSSTTVQPLVILARFLRAVRKQITSGIGLVETCMFAADAHVCGSPSMGCVDAAGACILPELDGSPFPNSPLCFGGTTHVLARRVIYGRKWCNAAPMDEPTVRSAVVKGARRNLPITNVLFCSPHP